MIGVIMGEEYLIELSKSNFRVSNSIYNKYEEGDRDYNIIAYHLYKSFELILKFIALNCKQYYTNRDTIIDLKRIIEDKDSKLIKKNGILFDNIFEINTWDIETRYNKNFKPDRELVKYLLVAYEELINYNSDCQEQVV